MKNVIKAVLAGALALTSVVVFASQNNNHQPPIQTNEHANQAAQHANQANQHEQQVQNYANQQAKETGKKADQAAPQTQSSQ